MIELLQWGRGFAATEGSLAAAFGGVLPPLQWGRGFAATEGQDHLLGGVFGVLLQWGRGFAATEGRSSGVPQVDIPGFNGAVASQPRKADTSHSRPCFRAVLQWGRGFAATEGLVRSSAVGSWPRLQWGRGFAATEGRTRRPAPGASCECFNGAVASQPRKERRWRVAARAGQRASMGPWLRSHGRSGPAVAAIFLRLRLQWGRGFAATEGEGGGAMSVEERRFNGAVASQPRKGLRRVQARLTHTGFNGAVASQPRKGPGVEPVAAHSSEASMGPWLRSHGRPVKLRTFTPTTRRFNGAVASQPRKGRAADGGEPDAAASMGPWLRSHGRSKSMGMGPAAVAGFNGAVASQPRKAAVAVEVDPPVVALQWGRGFAATEGAFGRLTGAAEARLQWGRGFAATEGHRRNPMSDVPSSFNGAVASQPRKGRHFAPGHELENASMGPWLRSHGRSTPSRLEPQSNRASMGPWLRSHGRPASWFSRLTPDVQASMGPWLRSHGRNTRCKRSCCLRERFNGAVASQPRKELPARVARAPARHASMGPWLRSHGRAILLIETAPAGLASMGPWLRSHGRQGRRGLPGRPRDASMGPWLRSHGRES